MLTDPIGDMITRIRNAYLAGHKTVEMPYSKVKLKIGEILAKEKYLVSAEQINDGGAKKRLKLTLRYQQKEPAIRHIKRTSKPGLRVYSQAKNLKLTLGGSGSAIISTPKGVMTVKQAWKEKLGGEMLCEVW